MKNVLKTKYLTLLAFLFISAMCFAQPGDEDDTEDEENAQLEPDAPIGDYIIPMLLVGVFVGYRFLKKEEEATV